MTPTSLEAAVNLNNKATTYMQKGDYGNATIALSQAVIALKSPTSERHEGPLASSFSSTSTVSFDLLSPKRPQWEARAATASIGAELNNENGSSSSSSWYLYEQSVHLNIGPQQELECGSSRDIPATVILSYAIFYNLGLCHHLDGLRAKRTAAQPTRRNAFKRAIIFYNQAQKLLNNHGEDFLLLDSNKQLIHSLAITNNLSHIYHCLDKEGTSNICVQRLWTAIVYHRLMDNKGARVMANHDDLCFQGLLTNVWNRLLVVGQSAPAAAA
mmetsp:Transcript_107113/g.160148  ORF Transcript_107113/g.160148 Transcript_107113/m.160148 type:complete len:271 (+) Transcript_107113:58-870(+)